MNFIEISQIILIGQYLLKIFNWLLIISGIATIVARLTKTKKDDRFWNKFRRTLEDIGNLFLPDRK